jgi:cytidylate kinase
MKRTRVPGRALVITVAGPHGSGRTTQATRLAERFGLRYVSTGTLFRDRAAELGLSLDEFNVQSKKDPDFDKWLDSRAREETRKGGVVLDATLSGWVAEEPDLRFYLYAPFDVRTRRIAEREGFTLQRAEEETRVREAAEAERFREFYGYRIEDLSIYDLILNTSLFDIEGVASILRCAVDEYLAREG